MAVRGQFLGRSTPRSGTYLPDCGSVGVAPASEFQAGQHQDLEVEAQAPVVDVPEITIDAPLHLLDARGLAAIAPHLRPAGDSGLNMMPERVFRQQIAIVIVMR